MPRQGITVFQNKNAKTGKALIIIKKTGFVDVWFFDQHFYWNERTGERMGPVDFNKMISVYNKSQQSKKQIVIIRR